MFIEQRGKALEHLFFRGSFIINNHIQGTKGNT